MKGLLEALLPSLGVLVIFVVAVRAMLQADRRERLAQARIERAEAAAARDDGVPGPMGIASGKDATAGADDRPGPTEPGSRHP